MIPRRVSRDYLFAILALLLWSTGLLSPAPLRADSDRQEDEILEPLAGFERFVEQAVVDWNVPGTGIAVVYGGRVIFAKGFGRRDIENDLPMTADTLFAIGSTTKAMTTTVLGMLVDEGRVDWDEPVRTYIPEFRMYDPVTTEMITPRDLVTHRSGLPRHDLVWYNNNESTREEIVHRLAYLAPSATLREKYQYNNLMFMTAGYLIERLTGGTWEQAIRTRLFEPLGMKRSNFSVLDSQKDEDFAQPYRENDEREIERIPFRVIDLIAPAGAVNSSVNEMSRWLLFNLNRGKVDGRQLINQGTLAEIHSPQMATGATAERPEISPAMYAMGWRVDTYRGHRRVAHGGGIDGFITSVVLFPDDGLGLVAFTNIGSDLPSVLNLHAADRVLGLDPIDWNGEGLERRAKAREAEKEAGEKKESTRVARTRTSHRLKGYVGTYHHPGYGTLKITRSGSKLSVTYNEITAPLEHWHYDVFIGGEAEKDSTFEDTKFQFRTNIDGLIAAVESQFEARVDPIVFRKRPDEKLFDSEYLGRCAGRYDLAGEPFMVELVGDALTVTFPGEPRYTLRPNLSGRFELAEFSTVSIAFEEDKAGKVVAAKVFQPDGVYEAPRIE